MLPRSKHPSSEQSLTRRFTFRLVLLAGLVLAAAANGGWKWTLPTH